jgi:hypothetical protein
MNESDFWAVLSIVSFGVVSGIVISWTLPKDN